MSVRRRYHITPLTPLHNIVELVLQYLRTSFGIEQIITETPKTQNRKGTANKIRSSSQSIHFFITFYVSSNQHPFEQQPFTNVGSPQSPAYIFAYPCNNERTFNVELLDKHLIDKFKLALEVYEKKNDSCKLEFNEDCTKARLYYNNPLHVQPDDDLTLIHQSPESLYASCFFFPRRTRTSAAIRRTMTTASTV